MEVSVILERCVGCAICELLCSLKHEGVFNPKKSRIRLSMKGVPESFEVAVCRQCAAPTCVKVCESGALSRDVQSGVVLINQQLCTGCESCVEACSYKSIWMNPEKNVAVKCDTCSGDPLCAKHCPAKALKFNGGG